MKAIWILLMVGAFVPNMAAEDRVSDEDAIRETLSILSKKVGPDDEVANVRRLIRQLAHADYSNSKYIAEGMKWLMANSDRLFPVFSAYALDPQAPEGDSRLSLSIALRAFSRRQEVVSLCVRVLEDQRFSGRRASIRDALIALAELGDLEHIPLMERYLDEKYVGGTAAESLRRMKARLASLDRVAAQAHVEFVLSKGSSTPPQAGRSGGAWLYWMAIVGVAVIGWLWWRRR